MDFRWGLLVSSELPGFHGVRLWQVSSMAPMRQTLLALRVFRNLRQVLIRGSARAASRITSGRPHKRVMDCLPAIRERERMRLFRVLQIRGGALSDVLLQCRSAE